jgi:hypothetical protein
MVYLSEIWDKLGWNRVNPLHSYQIRASRTNISIKAEKWPGKYVGEVSIANGNMSPPFGVETTLSSMNAWATKGAQRARTLKPPIDWGVQIGEIREATQLMDNVDLQVAEIKRRSHSKVSAIRRLNQLTRGLGNVGLGITFGVLPLQRLLTQLPTMVADVENAMFKAKFNDGKTFHRHITLRDTERNVRYFLPGACWPAQFAEAWMYENSGTVHVILKEKIWFETDLVYNLPVDSGIDKHETLRQIIKGTRIDGSVLYELTPFSWLIDWFTSAGAIINNSMDHTLYRFKNPCIMHESQHTKHVNGKLTYWTGHTPWGGSDVKRTVHPKSTVKVTVKRRQGYNWGSIGLTLEPLSGYQASVLAFLAGKTRP